MIQARKNKGRFANINSFIHSKICMFKLTGILKKEEIREFTRRDGSAGKNKVIFVEPAGSVYPIKITVNDLDFKTGKIGDTLNLDIDIYPYYFQDKKRKKAFVDYYIPNKK